MSVLEVDMQTFCGLTVLLDRISNIERYNFDAAVEEAKIGLRELGLLPENLLFKQTEIVVKKDYDLWKNYDLWRKRVLYKASLTMSEHGGMSVMG